MDATPKDLEAAVVRLKQVHRTTWEAGDYDAVSEYVLECGRVLAEAVAAGEGAAVLDVAAGSGSASIPTAQRGAHVTALDLAPSLLEAGRRRAAAAGVEIDWVEGDEALPFEDQSFDRVISCIGAMFAPRHEVAAAELARVCRPGGTIGLLSWTPGGYIGRLIKTVGGYMPKPPEWASPPPLSGDQSHVERLFAGESVDFRFERRTVALVEDSAESMLAFMETNFGPLLMARSRLEPEGRWDELRADLLALNEAADEGDGGYLARSEYLLAVGRKAIS